VGACPAPPESVRCMKTCQFFSGQETPLRPPSPCSSDRLQLSSSSRPSQNRPRVEMGMPPGEQAGDNRSAGAGRRDQPARGPIRATRSGCQRLSASRQFAICLFKCDRGLDRDFSDARFELVASLIDPSANWPLWAIEISMRIPVAARRRGGSRPKRPVKPRSEWARATAQTDRLPVRLRRK
jgi:hypothetical protein